MLEGTIPYLKCALLVAVVLGGFFVVAQSANAQLPNNPDISTEPTITGGLPNNPDISTEPAINTGSNSAGGIQAVGGVDAVAAGEVDLNGNAIPPAPQAEQVVTVTDSDSCWGSPPGFFHCIMVSFFGSFVAIAGYALDWSIHLFITQFGQMYIEYGIGAVVEGTWGTVRDIFNLTFIFGLVYIGFQIILGINESSAKRTIPLLIVAALLVNFSLFVVKFIVDFANLTALQIYNLFGVAKALGEGKEVVGEAAGGAIDVLGTFGPSISLAFINTIGVTSLLSHGPGADTAEGVPMFYTFGMIVVFLVLIYVFFAAAILITIRFAALTFYMIFSPIMFLGWVFPGMKKYSDQFWHGLFGQAFFAPALLFMLYITYQLSAGLAGDGLNREGGAAFANKADALDFAQFVPYLILIVVFMMASLIVAKKMANQGASMVGKVNDWAVSKAGNIARGVGSTVTYPVRGGARMALNSAGNVTERGLNNLQARGGFWGSVASMNFVDRAARNGVVGRLQNAEVGTGTTNKKEKEYRDKTRARSSQTTAENERRSKVTLAETTLANDALADTAEGAEQLNTALEDLAKSVSKMSTDELVSSSMKKNLYKSHYAVSLTDTQLTDLEKSGKLSTADISKIKAARESGYFNTATLGTAFDSTSQPAAFRSNSDQFRNTVSSRQRSNLAARSVTDIGKMPAKIFKEPEFVSNLTPLMLAERMKNGLNANDAQAIRSNIQSYVNGSLNVNGVAITPNQKQVEMWRRWTNNTDRGAEFGLNI